MIPSGCYSPADIPEQWRELLLNIPAYDAIQTAPEGCWFDPEAAKRSIDFFPKYLRHVEGDVAGCPFVLEPWQQAINANLFGWKTLDDRGRTIRRYREVFVYIPRGNGKTAWLAGICVFTLLCDGEPGAQIYGAASERDQATLLFRHAKGMVEQNPLLNKRCTIYASHRSIVRKDDAQLSYKVLSADAATKHGFNAHAVFVDELHAHPNRDLVDVLTTSTGKSNRKQPFIVYITTADYDRPSICNEKYQFADKVRKGIVAAPTVLPVIYEADRDDDWTDEKVWEKANPNLDITVSRQYLRTECAKAKEIVAYQNTFRRFHLCQMTESADRCIDIAKWDRCKREIDLESLKGRDCFAGLDIGATSDCALARLFPHDDVEVVEVAEQVEGGGIINRQVMRRSYTLLMDFWLPKRPVKRDHRMEAQIAAWIKEGWIHTGGDGDVIENEVMMPEVVKLLEPYYLMDFAFDRGWQGASAGNYLQMTYGEDKVIQFNQGVLSMAAPFREFLELTALGRLHHQGNPVMRWMVSNVTATSRGGLVKPDKDKSPEKIDGVTACCMALGQAGADVAGTSVYGSRGIISI